MNISSRPLLTPAEILRINRPYLLVMSSGSQPAITNSPDLSKWQFNKLLGLGDEEHNNQVRMARAIKRVARECEKIKIWDIGNTVAEKKRQELEEERENNKTVGLNNFRKNNIRLQ